MTGSDALEKLTDAVRVRHFPRAAGGRMGLWLRSSMAAVRGMGRFRAASVVQKGRERLSYSKHEDINPKHEDMD